MKSGYAVLTWLDDREGHQFVCHIDTEKQTYEELTNDEKETCSDVSQIVGTERW